jgi:putative membrane protein
VTEPDRAPPGGGSFDEAGDATRRTHLANERTYLAWWRTGLACLVVSLGAGKVVPSVSHQTRWPYAVLGAGFAVLGVLFIAYGLRRQREVEDAVMRARYQRLDERFAVWLTAVGVVLGVFLLVLVVLDT